MTAGTDLAQRTPDPRPAPVRLDAAELHRHPMGRADHQSDKEGRGSVLVIAGSREVPGAALLAGVAALRAGAGKLAIATAASVAIPLAIAVPEARVIGLPEQDDGSPDPVKAIAALGRALDGADAVIFGPGFVPSPALARLGHNILSRCPCVPLVVDAGALDMALLGPLAPHVLLTPHHGEMAHLLGCDKAEVDARAAILACEAAVRWKGCVALKSAATLIASPEGRSWVHEAGQAGLAMSGSGDVLAGLIGGLAAGGATLVDAALWGVALHSMAGQRLGERVGPVGYLARDLATEVPRLLHEWTASADAVRQPPAMPAPGGRTPACGGGRVSPTSTESGHWPAAGLPDEG